MMLGVIGSINLKSSTMFSFLKKQNISIKLSILFTLYFSGSIGIALIYIFNVENNIIFHSVFFLLVIFINRQSMEFYEQKNKFNVFLFFSILPFIIYAVLILLLRNNYFLQYKLLIIPPIFLSFYQMSKIVRIGK
ncbi:MAG: hypothetical protein BGO88_16470 [Flavobacterium sp. 38-13]|nr:MAG: hypothetical protein BGO88_16470 [Flavobacterium sp. 38-13]